MKWCKAYILAIVAFISLTSYVESSRVTMNTNAKKYQIVLTFNVCSALVNAFIYQGEAAAAFANRVHAVAVENDYLRVGIGGATAYWNGQFTDTMQEVLVDIPFNTNNFNNARRVGEAIASAWGIPWLGTSNSKRKVDGNNDIVDTFLRLIGTENHETFVIASDNSTEIGKFIYGAEILGNNARTHGLETIRASIIGNSSLHLLNKRCCSCRCPRELNQDIFNQCRRSGGYNSWFGISQNCDDYAPC